MGCTAQKRIQSLLWANGKMIASGDIIRFSQKNGYITDITCDFDSELMTMNDNVRVCLPTESFLVNSMPLSVWMHFIGNLKALIRCSKNTADE